MNILLTSIGRRSYLVNYFKDSLKGAGKVIVANTIATAPGMYAADVKEIVPSSSEPDYIKTIIALCKKHNISILCACHDLDVYILSQHQALLEEIGVISILPSANWGLLCLDKLLCGNKLESAGFNVPWSSVSLDETKKALANNEVSFPLITKARLGFGSMALSMCHSFAELETALNKIYSSIESNRIDDFLNIPANESVLIQECIESKERVMGVVNDLSGQYASHFICEVHNMRAGESDNATTIDKDFFGDLPKLLSQLTQHVGVWGVDILMKDNEPYIIDINPRFSGDYPFFHLAGADIPSTLVAWCRNEKPSPEWLSPLEGISGYKELVPTRINNH